MSGAREGKLARRSKRQFERHFAVMAASELEGRNLERAFDHAEIGDDHLPFADGAGEESAADGRIGSRALENSVALDARRFQSGAGQQLAPLPGRFLVTHIDALGIEGDLVAAQSGHGRETARARLVDLEQQITALLCGHVYLLSPPSPPRGEGNSDYPLKRLGGGAEPERGSECLAVLLARHRPEDEPEID